MVTSSELKKMTDAEQRRLFLGHFFEMQISDERVCIYFPVINPENGVMMAGSDCTCPLGGDYEAMCKHPDWNSYITVNLIEEKKPRKKEYVRFICGIYIDIDVGHTKDSRLTAEERAKYVEDVIARIDEIVADGTIPEPWCVVHSGRGLSIHYRYDPPIDGANDADAAWHKAAYQYIFDRLQELLGDGAPEKEIEVDRHVSDTTRICRIPGTRNCKAGRSARMIRFAERKYAPRDLYQAFGFDEERFEEYTEKLTPKKKVKREKTQKTSEKRRNASAKSVEAYVPDSEEIPSCKELEKKTANFNLCCLDSLFYKKRWVEGEHRKRFLFIVYNLMRLSCTAKVAYEKIMDYNGRMEEPLGIREINDILNSTDTHIETSGYHRDGLYRFSTKRILSPKWLNVPDELARECGFLKYEDRRKKFQENNALATERDKAVVELFLTGVTSHSEISRIIQREHQEYKCSRRTVGNIISRLGVKAGMRLEDIDFEGHKVYARGGKLSINRDFSQNFFLSKSKDNVLGGFEEIKDPDARWRRLLYEEKKMAALNAPADEKDQALVVLRGRDNVLLLGMAGTGKTYLVVERFYKGLSRKEKRVTVCLSFTGNAADGLPKGKTLHSFLCLRPGVYDPSEYQYSLPLGVERIIIDEVGLVRKDLMEVLLTRIKCTPWPVQLILMADFSQIGPILQSTGKEYLNYTRLHGNKVHPYESEMWDALNLRAVNLFKVERQQDPVFADMLLKVMCGLYEGVREIEEGATRGYAKDDKVPYICPTNKWVKAINEERIGQLENVQTFAPRNCEKVSEKDHECKVAVGMRVRTTVNEAKYKNGSLGTVTEITDDAIKVLLDGKKAEVVVKRHRFYLDDPDDGRSYEQFPIEPAYALTAEKAQGLTFDEVNVIPGYFRPGQLYVALSRCRTLKGIHLEANFSPSELIVDLNALMIGSRLDPAIDRRQEPDREPEI